LSWEPSAFVVGAFQVREIEAASALTPATTTARTVRTVATSRALEVAVNDMVQANSLFPRAMCAIRPIDASEIS
jgi:hypothetical protein